MRRFAALTLLLVLPVVAGAQDDAVKKDTKRLQGVWEVTKLVYNGSDFFAKGMAGFDFEFKGNEAVVLGNEKVRKEYARLRFQLIPNSTPPIMDLSITFGLQKDAKVEGIYDLKEKELKLCVRVFGNERPTEFASPAGSSIAYLILRKK